MRTSRLLGSTLALLAACTAQASTPDHSTALAWAYPPNTPAAAPMFPDERLTLPGVARSYTRGALNDRFAAPDWRPRDHPAMPPVVARGRKPAVMACGFCHLPTGGGRPENAALAGLPRAYIIAQMQAFHSGERRSAVAGRLPTEAMRALAKAATPTEAAAAAAYFSRLPYRSMTRVVEAARVPRTIVKGWVYARDPAGGTEATRLRIIETPDDFERFERRDPTLRYTAYVPPGSIARGAALARTWGGDGRFACAGCHGTNLGGTVIAPSLAGRSPTYLVRQLNDFRSGARHDAGSAPMRQVAAAMTPADMIALAAFAAARR